ncbi:hypothetical protein [Streptomyces sp. ZS0098]|uniref:hypothetical protein n=1 Tax=Streptomyces sp. ZS0098 TaxID=1904044 RepID=UPI001604B338|nr:hypothetical protein [Streptomyces sp. ZS0098]
MRIGVRDHAEDLVRTAPGGVDTVHRERGIGVRHPVRDGLDQCIPPRCWLVPPTEATLSFVVVADEVVRDGFRQPARQGDTEPGAQGPMGGEAPGEVALDNDRDASVEMVLDFLGRGEQSGKVQAHPRLDVRPLVHRASERLVEGRDGGDEDGLPSGGEHRRQG